MILKSSFASHNLSDIDHGTAIAYCANNDLIFIAVDSQINHERGLKSKGNKIHTTKTTTWVNSGLYRYSDKFDINQIIAAEFNEILNKNDFKLANILIRSKVENKLLEISLDIEELSPQVIKPDIPILSTLIINHTGELFHFGHINYYLLKNKEYNFSVSSKMIDSSEGLSDTIFNILGSDTFSRPFLDKMLKNEDTFF